MSIRSDTSNAFKPAPTATELELLERLIELQGQVVKLAQRNLQTEMVCAALREELAAVQKPGIGWRRLKWARRLAAVLQRPARWRSDFGWNHGRTLDPLGRRLTERCWL